MKATNTQRWNWALCVTALGLLASSVVAQDAELDSQPLENRYRIGIDCVPISEALQVHLHLDAGTGLIVNRVMEGSPADRAGIQRLDVIVTADERPVGDVTELIRAVNQAKAGKMVFSVIRRGEEMSLEVTPEERDEAEMEEIRRGFRNRLRSPGWLDQVPPEVQQQLEQFGPLDIFGFGADDPLGRRGFRRMLPGIMMDDPPAKLPHGFNLNMQVERQGDGPAKVTVEHDGKRWEVTEDHLEDLPEDIRPMVENMLHGGRGGLSGFMIPPQGQSRLRWTPQQAPEDDGQFKRRFDGLELQLQELRNAIRSLREGGE